MRRAAALLVLVLLVGPAAAKEEEGEKKKPDVNAKLAALLDVAKADATRIRGLPFLAEVPVKKITADEFRAQMMRDLHRLFGKGKQLERMQHLLQRLRILPAGTGIVTLMDRFFPKTVAANYDPFRKRISFLRGFSSRSIMVHELVHALQDQHFNLSRKVLDGPLEFDRLLALGALAEGDAESVQRHFDTKGVLALTPLPAVKVWGQQQIENYLERRKAFPVGIARPFIFQYFDGLIFVETIKRHAGGYKSLNRVWGDPPLTTEQVLHPERYIHRDLPVRIVPPDKPAGREILLQNTLGELGVRIVLESHLGKDWPRAAAVGWDGDRILLLANGDDDPILAWLTTWDTEPDAAEFADAAKAMLAVRSPRSAVSEKPERGLTVRVEAGYAHCIVHRGRDVLFATGLPKKGFAKVISALLWSTKIEVRTHRSQFGYSD